MSEFSKSLPDAEDLRLRRGRFGRFAPANLRSIHHADRGFCPQLRCRPPQSKYMSIARSTASDDYQGRAAPVAVIFIMRNAYLGCRSQKIKCLAESTRLRLRIRR